MMAVKKITAGVLALSILGTTAFATPQTPVVADNEQQDLLTIASNGALTSTSAGVQLLNQDEMDEVHGGLRIKIGKVKIKINKNCFATVVCIIKN